MPQWGWGLPKDGSVVVRTGLEREMLGRESLEPMRLAGAAVGQGRGVGGGALGPRSAFCVHSTRTTVSPLWTPRSTLRGKRSRQDLPSVSPPR